MKPKINSVLNSTQIQRDDRDSISQYFQNQPKEAIKEMTGLKKIILPNLLRSEPDSIDSIKSIYELNDFDNKPYMLIDDDAVFLDKKLVTKSEIGVMWRQAEEQIISFEGRNLAGEEFVSTICGSLSSFEPDFRTNKGILDLVVAEFKSQGVYPGDISMHITTSEVACSYITYYNYCRLSDIFYSQLKDKYGESIVTTTFQNSVVTQLKVYVDQIAIFNANNLGVKDISVDTPCSRAHSWLSTQQEHQDPQTSYVTVSWK